MTCGVGTSNAKGSSLSITNGRAFTFSQNIQIGVSLNWPCSSFFFALLACLPACCNIKMLQNASTCLKHAFNSFKSAEHFWHMQIDIHFHAAAKYRRKLLIQLLYVPSIINKLTAQFPHYCVGQSWSSPISRKLQFCLQLAMVNQRFFDKDTESDQHRDGISESFPLTMKCILNFKKHSMPCWILSSPASNQ